MKIWNKYFLDSAVTGVVCYGKDHLPEEFSRMMGGYYAGDCYKDRTAFFNTFFYGAQNNRFEYYNHFLRTKLKKGDDILSIASGRCQNELLLTQDGYKILCSDIDLYDMYRETKLLFDNFECIRLNIIKGPAPRKFDSIICLSFLYLLDNQEFNLFLKNASDSLKPNGNLICDANGSQDNFLGDIFHNFFLKYEIFFVRILKFILTGKLSGIIIKHHGYRRNDTEIISVARKYNLILESSMNYDFLSEFMRSILLNKCIQKSRFLKKAFSTLGKKYFSNIRIFNFRKISNLAGVPRL